MPSNHPFWENTASLRIIIGIIQDCRRFIIDTHIQIENPTMKSLAKHLKPMKDFRGDPIDNGNYWMMASSMFERGLRYCVINEFNMLDNIVTDFDSTWKGTSVKLPAKAGLIYMRKL